MDTKESELVEEFEKEMGETYDILHELVQFVLLQIRGSELLPLRLLFRAIVILCHCLSSALR